MSKHEEEYDAYFLENESITFKFSKSEGKEGESVEEVNGKKIKLSFEGKSPVGGEVRLYKDGDIEVVNLTDGTYYANKDTEIEVSETTTTLTRGQLQAAVESLQKEIIELKDKNTAQDTKIKNMESKNATQDTAINTNKDNIETNKTNIEKLTTIVNSINTSMLSKTYPVGSIYISTNSTNPSSIFGGTWERYGTGRTLVGVNTSDANFNTVSKTGGSTTFNNSHTHTVSSHTHTINSHVHTIAAHKHLQTIGANDSFIYALYGAEGGLSGREIITTKNYRFNPSNGILSETKESLYYTSEAGGGNTNGSGVLTTNGNAQQTTGTSGSSTQSLLQPYITVYMWKRVS